jgi:hypothetical protein
MDQLRLRHVSTNGIVKATSEYLFWSRLICRQPVAWK